MNMSELYEHAVKCERAYHAAIVDEYGEAHAGQARYKLHHQSPAVNRVRFEMREANTEWLAAMKGQRSGEVQP